MEEFFEKHAETEQLVMMLQEEIKFDEYYRCYCIGGKYVRIMPYEPRNPHHLRYVADFTPDAKRYKLMEDIVLRICRYLGYDFNTVELAIRDGVPYAIDFCNPAPDAEVTSVGAENFEWTIKGVAPKRVYIRGLYLKNYFHICVKLMLLFHLRKRHLPGSH
jgi:hypothetical protein